MALTRVGEASVSGTTPSVSGVAGIANGDFVIAIAYRGASTTAPSLPSGWTSLGIGSNTGSIRIAYRFRQAGDANPVFTNATEVAVGVYRGVDTVTPTGAQVSATGNSASIGAPSLNLQNTDGTSWAWAGYGHERSSSFTVGSPLTERVEIGTAGSHRVGHSDTNGAAANIYPGATITVDQSRQWQAVSIELRAADRSFSVSDSFKLVDGGLDTVAYRDSTVTTVEAGGASGADPGMPAAAVAGDVLIASVVVGDDVIIATPTGWTQIDQRQQSDGLGIVMTSAIFESTFDLSPTTAFTWTGTPSAVDAVVGIGAYSKSDGVGNWTIQQGNAQSNIGVADVAITDNGSMEVIAMGGVPDTASATATAPTGLSWRERYDASTAAAGATWGGLYDRDATASAGVGSGSNWTLTQFAKTFQNYNIELVPSPLHFAVVDTGGGGGSTPVSGSEASTLSETSGVDVAVAASDTATASDTAAIAVDVAATDALAFTDTAALDASQPVTGSEAGALAEASALAAASAVADAGALGEAASIVVTIVVTDVATSTDASAPIDAQLSRAESGSLTDASSPIDAQLSRVESGALTDASSPIDAQLQRTDTGALTDTRGPVDAQLARVESGALTDVVSPVDAQLARTDSATATDNPAVIAAALNAADSAAQADTSSPSAAAAAQDTGALAESSSISGNGLTPVSGTEAATATETSSLSATVSATESATAVDTAAIAAQLARTDALTLTDVAQLLILTALAATDTAALADAAALAADVAVSDTFTFDEQASIDAELVALDDLTLDELALRQFVGELLVLRAILAARATANVRLSTRAGTTTSVRARPAARVRLSTRLG